MICCLHSKITKIKQNLYFLIHRPIVSFGELCLKKHMQSKSLIMICTTTCKGSKKIIPLDDVANIFPYRTDYTDAMRFWMGGICQMP